MCWPSVSVVVKRKSCRPTSSASPKPSAAWRQRPTKSLARLLALQAVNPSVRDSEINALRKQREDGLAMLEKAALRLEAIRVLVAG